MMNKLNELDLLSSPFAEKSRHKTHTKCAVIIRVANLLLIKTRAKNINKSIINYDSSKE